MSKLALQAKVIPMYVETAQYNKFSIERHMLYIGGSSILRMRHL